MQVQDIGVVQQASLPLYEARGWLKFLGILSIIQGVLAALSIVGIILCWLPIWLGMLLLGSANRLEQAAQSGQVVVFVEAQRKLKTYFIINGVMTLVGLAAAAVILALAFAGIIGGGLEEMFH